MTEPHTSTADPAALAGARLPQHGMRLSDAGALRAGARAQRRLPTALLVTSALAAIALANSAVETSLLAHLYCIPIVIAAVRLGTREGIVAAIAATTRPRTSRARPSIWCSTSASR